MKDAHHSLLELLAAAGLHADLARSATLTGADPVLALPYRIAAAAQAVIAASGVAASAVHAQRGAAQQRITVPADAAVAAMRSYRYFKIDGVTPPDNGDALTGFYPTGDGRWVYLHCNFFNLKRANLAALGTSDDKAAVMRSVAGWNGQALEEALYAAGGCGALVRSPEEWRSLPQFDAVVQEPLLQLRRVGDAPRLALPAAARPLDGVRVIDMTRVLAGPTATKVLASHGAEVLRLNREDLADSGFFDFDNGLGKRSAFLDLRSAPGRSAMDTLLHGCDVFVQAYRPEALAGLGYGPADLVRRRPGLVVVNLNAWGFTGPWRGRRGYDTVVQSANGLAWTGPDQAPRFLPVAAQDYLAGYLMALGATAALHRRQQEGGSWQVDISLARVGEWFRSHGTVDPAAWTAAPAELPADRLAACMTESASAVGRLSHLRAMPDMDATPPHWGRPAVPRGTHQPAWTDVD